MVEDKWGTNKRLVFMYDENGAPNTVYYYNNSTSATKYYYVLNLQGDVTEIRSTSNALVAQYNYDAFGNILSIKDANGANITSSTHIANVNPLRYRGYFYDTETGFYYLNSRYYDPATRRFISADSVIDGRDFDGLNLYAYCWNNPVNMIDISGGTPSPNLPSYYINDQGVGALVDFDGKKIRMETINWGGLGNIAKNGCGPIAVYNALASDNSRVTFGDVVKNMSKSRAPYALGLLGTDPETISGYMRSKFYSVIEAPASLYYPSLNYTVWNNISLKSDVIIIYYRNPNSLSMHYITGIRRRTVGKRAKYVFLNTYVVSAYKEVTVQEFLGELYRKGGEPEHIWGMKGRIGFD